MDYQYKVTVFTPTYNRAYIIENLYRSLQKQTCMDFEWLVVDDGSGDETPALFDKLCQEENGFSIRYVRKENGGKCSAINRGLELAQGELFFTVDSDDYLTEDAVEKVIRWDTELPKDEKYCGFAGNRGITATETPNRMFDGGYYDGTLLDRYGDVTETYGLIDGERAYVFYTDVHRKYLYPVFPGEKFLTEAVTWDLMAHDGYKMRFYNDIIWIWEYKADGLTKAGYQVFLNNPRGTGLFFRQKAEFLNFSLRTRLGMWYGYVCDTKDRCTNAQIAEYIGMPLWMVQPMKIVHTLWQLIKKKR
ncbi:MAG: glycosyltransferase family 2 protein [Oscillospiraceae bacterium]|nr:glycosyltransferase family 2 protein [Oscillospiraceae bacterium]